VGDWEVDETEALETNDTTHHFAREIQLFRAEPSHILKGPRFSAEPSQDRHNSMANLGLLTYKQASRGYTKPKTKGKVNV
jgi:hypothetical protein